MVSADRGESVELPLIEKIEIVMSLEVHRFVSIDLGKEIDVSISGFDYVLDTPTLVIYTACVYAINL